MHLLYAQPDFSALFFITGTIAALLVVTVIASVWNANKLVRIYGRGNSAAKVFDTIFLVCMALLVVTVLVAGLIQSNMTRDAVNTLKEDRISWIESHGVTTQSSTITDLEFPNEEPDEDAKFGIAQVISDDNSVVSVHLAWENDKFVLYGTDGQPLERLDN